MISSRNRITLIFFQFAHVSRTGLEIIDDKGTEFRWDNGAEEFLSSTDESLEDQIANDLSPYPSELSPEALISLVIIDSDVQPLDPRSYYAKNSSKATMESEPFRQQTAHEQRTALCIYGEQYSVIPISH